MGQVRIFGSSEDTLWTPEDGDGDGRHVADVCGVHLDGAYRELQGEVLS